MLTIWVSNGRKVHKVHFNRSEGQPESDENVWPCAQGLCELTLGEKNIQHYGKFHGLSPQQNMYSTSSNSLSAVTENTMAALRIACCSEKGRAFLYPPDDCQQPTKSGRMAGEVGWGEQRVEWDGTEQSGERGGGTVEQVQKGCLASAKLQPPSCSQSHGVGPDELAAMNSLVQV